MVCALERKQQLDGKHILRFISLSASQQLEAEAKVESEKKKKKKNRLLVALIQVAALKRTQQTMRARETN